MKAKVIIKVKDLGDDTFETHVKTDGKLYLILSGLTDALYRVAKDNEVSIEDIYEVLKNLEAEDK